MAKKRANVPFEEQEKTAQAAMQQFDEAVSKKAKLVGQMDQELNAVREKYASEVNDCDNVIAEKEKELKEFAKKNPQLFDGRKTYPLVHGTVGFRTGTPKVKFSAGWNEESILDALSKTPLASYIVTMEKVDKEGIIRDRDNLKTEDLARVGMAVVQDEKIHVIPASATENTKV